MNGKKFVIAVIVTCTFLGVYAQDTETKAKEVETQSDNSGVVINEVKTSDDESQIHELLPNIEINNIGDRVGEVVSVHNNEYKRRYFSLEPVEDDVFRIVEVDGTGGKKIVPDFSKEPDPEAAEKQYNLDFAWNITMLGFYPCFNPEEIIQQAKVSGAKPPTFYIGPSDLLFMYDPPEFFNGFFDYGMMKVGPNGEVFYGVAIYDKVDGKYVKLPLPKPDEQEFQKALSFWQSNTMSKAFERDLKGKWVELESYNKLKPATVYQDDFYYNAYNVRFQRSYVRATTRDSRHQRNSKIKKYRRAAKNTYYDGSVKGKPQYRSTTKDGSYKGRKLYRTGYY